MMTAHYMLQGIYLCTFYDGDSLHIMRNIFVYFKGTTGEVGIRSRQTQ